jgi:uncharacterized membrane protein
MLPTMTGPAVGEPARVVAAPRRWSWASRFRVRQYVKSSLWFVPLLGGLLGLALAFADLAIDPHVQLPADFTYSSGTASSVLSTIVGAMVGLLGFVVTIGVLVVQTATGTLSPRFMRLWYRDPLQKVVLATFSGTFTFAFTLLRKVDDAHVPSIGVTIAGVLVTVSLFMLLVFLDRFTHVLRPVAVGDLMVRYGLAAMRPPAAIPGATPRDIPCPPRIQPDLAVRSDRGGVVQAVNVRGLFETAQKHRCRIVLTRPPGAFVSIGATVAEVYGDGDLPDPVDIAGLVALGIERTIDQDPAFALRILVDIAIRALSPAVNDPTTAIQMLNHIEIFIEAVTERGHRVGAFALVDPDGVERLVAPSRSVEDFLLLATTEIMDYGGRSIQVCRRLLALFDSLDVIIDPADRPALQTQRARLDALVTANFAESEQMLARRADGQGIGGADTGPAESPVV